MKWGLTQGMLGRALETLAPSMTAVGPNTYLTRNDFFKMLGFAFGAHVLVFGIASLFPHEEVTNIPVRALSFKLGDEDRVAAYGAPTGVGVSTAPIAAPVMRAMAHEPERVAPVAAPVPAPVAKPVVPPKPVKAAKIAPIPKPVPVPVKPAYTPSISAPAIAATPQQYVREVGQANALAPLPTTQNPVGYGARDGAIGGQGTVTTQTEKTAREIRQRYEQQISSWIERHKLYPAEAAGRSGRVTIRMRIDRAGTIRYYAIEQSSGVQAIDAAAVDMIRRANPVPAVPENYSSDNSLEFLIPINFQPPQ